MKTYDMSLLTKKIYESSAQLFSLTTLREHLGLEKSGSLYKIVNRLLESGVLIKIERNKYCLKNYTHSDYSISNFIYEPSYVSFESALSYYGILSQFPYEVTSATLGQTRSKEFNGKKYGYYHLKKSLFWGYVKEDNYLIADKEKALADQLYLASKGIKKIHLDEYNLLLINKSKLKLYISKYPQTSQFKKTIANLIN
ncbi:hypothetical protein GW881_04075 [Candidatus Roizmanbacteria bacterium]|nr:hypothetical protein [Candidatus Roizmanbacteria bacterium]